MRLNRPFPYCEYRKIGVAANHIMPVPAVDSIFQHERHHAVAHNARAEAEDFIVIANAILRRWRGERLYRFLLLASPICVSSVRFSMGLTVRQKCLPKNRLNRCQPLGL